jgi:hypothetical protein
MSGDSMLSEIGGWTLMGDCMELWGSWWQLKGEIDELLVVWRLGDHSLVDQMQFKTSLESGS